MTELAEAAIEMALLARAKAFATTQSLTISQPNVDFTPPTPSSTAKYLTADFLPAPTISLEIPDDGASQFYGILQIAVMYGAGAGAIPPGRLAAQVVDYFARGTVVRKDGFAAKIYNRPTIATGFRDGAWWRVPVSIPYRCFA